MGIYIIITYYLLCLPLRLAHDVPLCTSTLPVKYIPYLDTLKRGWEKSETGQKRCQLGHSLNFRPNHMWEISGYRKSKTRKIMPVVEWCLNTHALYLLPLDSLCASTLLFPFRRDQRGPTVALQTEC